MADRMQHVGKKKRQQVSRACDACRAFKRKCSAGVPCQTCIKFRKQCTFTDRIRKRGRKKLDKNTVAKPKPKKKASQKKQAEQRKKQEEQERRAHMRTSSTSSSSSGSDPASFKPVSSNGRHPDGTDSHCDDEEDPDSIAECTAATPLNCEDVRVCPCGFGAFFDGAGPQRCKCGMAREDMPRASTFDAVNLPCAVGPGVMHPHCPGYDPEHVRQLAKSSVAAAQEWNCTSAAACPSLRLLSAHGGKFFSLAPSMRDLINQRSTGVGPLFIDEDSDAHDALFVLPVGGPESGMLKNARAVAATRPLLKLLDLEDESDLQNRLFDLVCPPEVKKCDSPLVRSQKTSDIARLSVLAQTTLPTGKTLTATKCLIEIFFDQDHQPAVVSFRFGDYVELADAINELRNSKDAQNGLSMDDFVSPRSVQSETAEEVTSATSTSTEQMLEDARPQLPLLSDELVDLTDFFPNSSTKVPSMFESFASPKHEDEDPTEMLGEEPFQQSSFLWDETEYERYARLFNTAV